MSVSIVFARSVIAELQHRGLDGHELLRKCQIEPARLDDIHETLQPDDMERITRHALEMTGDPGLGLSVGASQAESSLQLFGHLVRAQGTVRGAACQTTA